MHPASLPHHHHINHQYIFPQEEVPRLVRNMDQTEVLTPKQIRNEKIRIWKNVLVVSLGFLLLFMSFSSVSALQSSINSDNGLGTYSLTVIYVGLVFSSLFLVTFTIHKLTAKWTIVVCNLCYMGYIAAQFHPNFYTLLPTGLLVGLAAAPLWSAKCTYISVIGKRYSELCALQRTENKQSSEHSTVMLFFGIFFATFQSAGIWGNLITSSGRARLFPRKELKHILSSGETKRNTTDVSFCGKNFCEDFVDQVENLKRPEEWRIHLISGIFVAIAFSSALFIAFLLDPLSRFQKVANERQTSGFKLVFATFAQLKNLNQALILVLVFYGGMEQGFFEADFSKAFVGCTWGIEKIGYVLMAAKAMNSFGSAFSGKIVKYTGRIPVFLAAFVVNVATLVYLLTWEPSVDETYALFIMAGTYMLADSIWQTQINGLHGVLFHDNVEAAFSAYKVFESLGFIIAFLASPLLCVRIKLYSLLSVLTLGIACYGVLETRERKLEVRAIS
ncbi:unnamed protein product [Notodromas monacha]|uniref:UNC93-like protein n=1 Tax=Notodromas monacha TaxID=399045 RepID=A0A7R9BML4_9CRUS|nr:unnamed protein product [Notodromas monacha]CAG0918284.1 unnamed protein product [Notodromas monacha]